MSIWPSREAARAREEELSRDFPKDLLGNSCIAGCAPRRQPTDVELVRAHFWVDDRLYEADYYKAIGQGGGAQVVFVKVHQSERPCQCPGHEALERQRQGVPDVKSA